MRSALILTILFGCAISASADSTLQPRLALRVSPAMAVAPAAVTVRATVAANPDNRVLEVVAESPTFRRASQIQLNGSKAPRVSVFELRGLPSGTYDVTAVLVGADGKRTHSIQVLNVIPSARSR